MENKKYVHLQIKCCKGFFGPQTKNLAKAQSRGSGRVCKTKKKIKAKAQQEQPKRQSLKTLGSVNLREQAGRLMHNEEFAEGLRDTGWYTGYTGAGD